MSFTTRLRLPIELDQVNTCERSPSFTNHCCNLVVNSPDTTPFATPVSFFLNNPNATMLSAFTNGNRNSLHAAATVLAAAVLGPQQADAACGALPLCKPFREIYGGGKQLCENMWGDAFKYEPEEDKGFGSCQQTAMFSSVSCIMNCFYLGARCANPFSPAAPFYFPNAPEPLCFVSPLPLCTSSS